jgi:hypothetical protein
MSPHLAHKRVWTSRLTLLGAVALAACDSPLPPETQSDQLPLLASAIVSNPVAATTGASTTPGLALSGTAVDEIVYVSLPPGTIAEGTQATLRNLRTGSEASVAMLDGGFDPVAVTAAAGDTLEIDIQLAGGDEPLRYAMVVPSTRPPSVVRTDPPPKKRDVPLNAAMVVVFSEPVEPRTVTPQSVRLLTAAGEPVAGSVTVDADGLRVQFQSDQILAPGADYRLVVTTAVTDLTGDVLVQEVSTDFTTMAPLAAAIVSNPITLTTSASVAVPGLALQGAATAGSEVVYVSLPPGTMPWGNVATVRSPRTGSEVTLPMVDGGFDPVAVTAAAGDVLELVVQLTARPPLRYALIVPATRAPTVVRMDPSPNKQAVSLDAPIMVVFSEPVDPRTAMPENVQVLREGARVAGSLTVEPDGLRVRFQPDKELTPIADYQVMVTNGVTDLTEEPLLQTMTGHFRTVPTSGTPPAVLEIAFTVTEYRYGDSNEYWWNYTPQVRVTETGGASAARIMSMTFTMPGLELGLFNMCPTLNNIVDPGQSQDLIWERYGEYELAFTGVAADQRATGSDATVVIRYRDDVGRMDSLRVQGPVVPGDPPTTYTAAQNHGYSWCIP